jgi:hypothetical protein
LIFEKPFLPCPPERIAKGQAFLFPLFNPASVRTAVATSSDVEATITQAGRSSVSCSAQYEEIELLYVALSLMKVRSGSLSVRAEHCEGWLARVQYTRDARFVFMEKHKPRDCLATRTQSARLAGIEMLRRGSSASSTSNALRAMKQFALNIMEMLVFLQQKAATLFQSLLTACTFSIQMHIELIVFDKFILLLLIPNSWQGFFLTFQLLHQDTHFLNT